MNVRIKELAKDYLVHERFGRYGESVTEDYYEFYPDDLAEFAELIVRECLSFCEYDGDRFDEYDSGMQERARIIRESIREHFGMDDRGGV